jgi:hypothetical protein
VARGVPVAQAIAQRHLIVSSEHDSLVFRCAASCLQEPRARPSDIGMAAPWRSSRRAAADDLSCRQSDELLAFGRSMRQCRSPRGRRCIQRFFRSARPTAPRRRRRPHDDGRGQWRHARGRALRPGDMAAQLELALDNLEAVLAAGDMTLINIVRLNGLHDRRRRAVQALGKAQGPRRELRRPLCDVRGRRVAASGTRSPRLARGNRR